MSSFCKPTFSSIVKLTKSLAKPKLNPTILNCHVEFFGKSTGTGTLNNFWYILPTAIASSATKIQSNTMEKRIFVTVECKQPTINSRRNHKRQASFPFLLVQPIFPPFTRDWAIVTCKRKALTRGITAQESSIFSVFIEDVSLNINNHACGKL